MTPSVTIWSALTNWNVRAFLLVIRRGESSLRDDAYTIINGGSHFTAPPWVHPYDSVPTTQGGRAAGAYQFLGTTWGRLRQQYPVELAEFTPRSQDFAAVALIAGRGALDDVIAGRFEQAVAKLRPEWTSLPGAAESGGWTVEGAKQLWQEYGGAPVASGVSPAPAPAAPAEPEAPPPASEPPPSASAPPEVSTPVPARTEARMPILAALLPQIVAAIPSLISIFGKGGNAEKNAKAAQVVADVVVKATDAVNLQEATEKLAADPKALAAASAAVNSDPFLVQLLEVGGGIQEARKAASNPAQIAFWQNPAWWISMVLIAMPFLLLVDVFYVHSSAYNGEIRTQIVTAILNVILMVGAFWLGTSFGSSRKTELLAEQRTT